MKLGEVKDPTIDKTVSLTIPKETPNGKVFRLKKLGMPRLGNPKECGNLYATVEAVIPDKLSKAEIELIKKWRDLRSS